MKKPFCIYVLCIRVYIRLYSIHITRSHTKDIVLWDQLPLSSWERRSLVYACAAFPVTRYPNAKSPARKFFCYTGWVTVFACHPDYSSRETGKKYHYSPCIPSPRNVCINLFFFFFLKSKSCALVIVIILRDHVIVVQNRSSRRTVQEEHARSYNSTIRYRERTTISRDAYGSSLHNTID